MPDDADESAPDDSHDLSTDAIEPFKTEDGSYSLVDRDRDLHYSSTHGAADEARHVFVDGTRIIDAARARGTGHVLEFGFGGGVNFVQTVAACLESGDEIDRLVYHAVEHRPVAGDTVDFHSGPVGGMVRRALNRARHASDNAASVDAEIDGLRCHLHLHPIRWRTLELEEVRVDAVYFDPFGPGSQPDAWTTECFEVAKRHIRKDGRLTTYSAASDVKRALFEANFCVASAPGAGPKREMTVASPTADALEGLDLLERSDYL